MKQELQVRSTSVPATGFGTWELTGRTAYRAVRHALDVGYRHVDTAQAYGNEQEVGRALADSPVDRDEVFVTTKVWPDNAAPEDTRTSHEDSLRRLDTDYVDLLLLHWPTGPAPIEATVEAMDELRRDGKARLIGVSNHTVDQLHRAAGAGPVACNQVEYHPLLSQDKVLDAVRQHDMFLGAYSPLAHGAAVDHPELAAIGLPYAKSAAQVALRWLLDQDDVAVLPRSQTPAHIEANLDLGGFALSGDERARIDALPKDRRQIDPEGLAPDWD